MKGETYYGINPVNRSILPFFLLQLSEMGSNRNFWNKNNLLIIVSLLLFHTLTIFSENVPNFLSYEDDNEVK